MTKKIFAVMTAFMLASAVFAYAPAVGSESLFELSSTSGMTYASSVAGGGVSYITPASISVNPALTAKQQRVGLNAGYTALFTNTDKLHFGSAFQVGLLVPFKWAVVTGEIYGMFPDSPCMTIGNSVTFKGALSKEITEHLDVGMGFNTGVAWGPATDWGLGMNLGFVYDIPKLSFMKDFRYGVSISNLGKNYASEETKDFLSSYPGFMTIRGGAAALLFANDTLKIGGSFDLSTPCFMNLIIDTGFQLTLKDMLTISVAEKINMRESINGYSNYIPSIGMMFTFKFNTSNGYLASHDWSESEMTVGTAYKQLYKNVTAVTTDVDLRMGLKDETPPEILIWFNEEEDE